MIIFNRLLRIPTTLKELQEFIDLHAQLVNDIPKQEAQFPIIKDQYQILRKYTNLVMNITI